MCDDLNDMESPMGVPLRDLVDIAPHLGDKIRENPHMGA